MLRSKNLKRILEQALSRDVSLCAVFNEDGVVIAHASSPNNCLNSSGKRDSTRLVTQTVGGQGTDVGRYNRQSPESSRYQGQYGDENRVGYDYGRNTGFYQAGEMASGTGFLNGNGKYKGGSAESPQRRQNSGTGTAVSLGGSHMPSFQQAAGGVIHQHDVSQTTDSDSCSSSFNDELIEGTAGMSTREKLEDDLAIAANLWQSYESMSSLIERKEPDIDEYTGDVASDIQEDVLGNSLNMIIIECVHGKAVVSRLGNYRLFILSKPTTPLGLLKHKSMNLGRYLEECLHLN
ncbi:hypothetical protein LPJ73_002436 [Coemansia sp. RSA 2703]|nr:hypothetical protein LPJ73_002436 [Coemansia sp. RSA 2703]KAJ2363475.1 hypothetical protein IW150_006724 [Coemansia sp. RSA 2607]